MSSVAVQTAVGAMGEKATTELSFGFDSMIDAGDFQYGLNSSGIYLLNQGNDDDGTAFTSTVTVHTSDYGRKNLKRIRYVYLEVEVYDDTLFEVGVRPNKGSWTTAYVSTTGAGLKTLRATMPKDGGKGNYHAVRISSTGQFRLHSLVGLFVLQHIGARRS